MYVDRILYPVTSLGPGRRLVIWVAGCSRRCRGCANPELWIRHPQQRIEASDFANTVKELLDTKEVEGITITGGEPFDQAGELKELLEALDFDRDVLVFSGYKIEDIRKNSEMNTLLDKVSVVIDGEYIDELNDGQTALRGSLNQQLHFVKPQYRSIYDEYIKLGRQIQNFTYDYRTLSVGIHKSDVPKCAEASGGKDA